jgi:HEAT repeat protein
LYPSAGQGNKKFAARVSLTVLTDRTRNASVRSAAARLLEHLHYFSSTSDLTAVLHELNDWRDIELRHSVVSALSRIETDDAFRAWSQWQNTTKPAIEAQEQAVVEQNLDQVISYLWHPDRKIRNAAANILCKYPIETTITKLGDILTSQDPHVVDGRPVSHINAILVLSRLNSYDAEGYLIKALGRSEPEVIACAASYLAKSCIREEAIERLARRSNWNQICWYFDDFRRVSDIVRFSIRSIADYRASLRIH